MKIFHQTKNAAYVFKHEIEKSLRELKTPGNDKWGRGGVQVPALAPAARLLSSSEYCSNWFVQFGNKGINCQTRV
jgi:hypothetical protein